MIDQANPYTLHTLDNGLRVVIEQMPDVRSAAAGFLAVTGARDEPRELAGVSHFLEHMMFKGTSKRNWREITVDFDEMGSSYNAYTSEDRTVYYGWVRCEELDRQMELLADMMRSSIPAEEFATEKKVVLEEIAMGKDNLDHLAFDFLQEKVFEGHPLAWPILGYESSVERLTRDQMWDYFRHRYVPNRMMLIIAGNVDPQRMIDKAQQLCGDWPAMQTEETRKPATLKTGVDSLVVERFNQQVVALTFPAASACDPRAETVAAASTILGGDNSRFFWNIVQKGLATRAGVYHMDYSDCGAMILCAVCQPENVERTVTVMREEAKRMCEEPATHQEVQRVKNKRRTALAIESEVPYHRLSQIMDDMETHGKPRTIEQMLAEVEAVTPESIHNYLQAFPMIGEGHLSSVGPLRWPETQNALDAGVS